MTNDLKGAELVQTTEHVFNPQGASITIQSEALAQPTQLRRPWRSTARTVFQALIGLALMWPLIIEALDLGDWAWVGASLAVSGAITRLMAVPAVEVWLRRFVPWLAAAPKQ